MSAVGAVSKEGYDLLYDCSFDEVYLGSKCAHNGDPIPIGF